MGDLSTNFSRSEFTCRGHGQPGHRAHHTPVEPRLIASLQTLRDMVGRPVRIISGHRCSWWNARVGGARRSRHLVTDAADIPEGVATVAQAEAAGFDGIGSRGPWAVHVDRRGYRARWKY